MCLMLGACLLYATGVCAQEQPAILEPEPDRPMSVEPSLVVFQAPRAFDDQYVELWQKAMARPETGLRRQVMQAVLRAVGLGFADQMQPLTGPIAARLKNSATPPAEIATAIRTLHACDARGYADAVAGHINHADADVMRAADAALSDWEPNKHTRAWTRRATSAAYLLSARRSAVRAIAPSNAARAADELIALLLDPDTPGPLRGDVARLLGEAPGVSVVTAANQLNDGSPLERQLAAWALKANTTPAGLALLHEQARSKGLPPLQAAAALSLEAGGDAGLVPAMESLRRSTAYRARLVVARSRLDQPLQPGGLREQADLLGDENPTVRNATRRTLAARARLDGSDRAAVIAELNQTLADPAPDAWRRVEQAALLARDLDSEESVEALMALVEFPRLESRLAVLRALRALSGSELMPRVLEHARALAQVSARDVKEQQDKPDYERRSGVGKQLAIVHEMLGEKRYEPGVSYLRRFIPKRSPYAAEARAAAVWALGHIFAGSEDAGLTREFASRLSDVNPVNPEFEHVRRMSAVSIGRIKSRAGLGAVEEFSGVGEGVTKVALACRWAAEQLTGEASPPIDLEPIVVRGWFLEPLR